MKTPVRFHRHSRTGGSVHGNLLAAWKEVSTQTHRGVANGDSMLIGGVHVDVVVADGHVAEGGPSGPPQRREQHVPPVLRQLIRAITESG